MMRAGLSNVVEISFDLLTMSIAAHSHPRTFPFSDHAIGLYNCGMSFHAVDVAVYEKSSSSLDDTGYARLSICLSYTVGS